MEDMALGGKSVRLPSLISMTPFAASQQELG